MVRHRRPARSDRVALPGRLDPPVPVRRGALRTGQRPGPPPGKRGPDGSDAADGDPPRISAGRTRSRSRKPSGALSPVARGAADRARPAVPPGVRGEHGGQADGSDGEQGWTLQPPDPAPLPPRDFEGGPGLPVPALFSPGRPARRVHPGRGRAGHRLRPRRDRRDGQAAARRRRSGTACTAPATASS